MNRRMLVVELVVLTSSAALAQLPAPDGGANAAAGTAGCPDGGLADDRACPAVDAPPLDEDVVLLPDWEAIERKANERRASRASAVRPSGVPADDLPPKHGGFVLGGRLGFALGYSPDLGLVGLPFQLDVGGRHGFGLGFSGYFQLLPAICSISSCLSYRLGLQTEFRFLNERGPVMPWVGAGFGWAWLEEKVGYLYAVHQVESGPELVLQVGFDFQLWKRWAVGPYLAAHAWWRVDSTFFPWLILGVRSSTTF